MKLLTEHLTFDQAGMIVEAMEDTKTLYMKGIFIQGGVRNFNERVYPVKEIGRAVERVNEIWPKGKASLVKCDHRRGTDNQSRSGQSSDQ